MNERTNERTFDLDFSSLSRNRTVGFDNVQRPRSFTDCFTSGTPHSVKVQMQDDDENKALRCSTKSCWKNKRECACTRYCRRVYLKNPGNPNPVEKPTKRKSASTVLASSGIDIRVLTPMWEPLPTDSCQRLRSGPVLLLLILFFL